MKKSCILLSISFIAANVFAQNVGIGTLTPTANLEVKKPLKSTLKISSNSFTDTSEIVFSNKNIANEGTDMRLTHIKETGIRISSNSDIASFNVDTIMQITPLGNVGIRTATPAYPLDVKGDVNITGELKANGTSGSEGQFLRSNGNGTMSWAGGEKYKNFKVFRNDGNTASSITTTFTIPTGITELGIEIWGGGGQATSSGSGASGAYIYAQIPTAGYTTLNVTVGAGGGCATCIGPLGITSSVALPSNVALLTARGGYNTAYLASQGTYTATGSYLPNVSYFGIEGESAKPGEIFYENTPTGYVVFTRNAGGADAPTRPKTGGRSGWRRTNFDGSSPTFFQGFKGSEPGGGGGFPDADGGNGQVIVYW
jgi:hypothetical protein